MSWELSALRGVSRQGRWSRGPESLLATYADLCYARSSGGLLAELEISELKRGCIFRERSRMLKSVCSVRVAVKCSSYTVNGWKKDQRAAAVYDRKRRKAYIRMVMIHRSSSSNFLLKLRQLLDCDSMLSTRKPHQSGCSLCHNCL